MIYDKPFLPIKEAAQLTGLSVFRVRQMVLNHETPFIKSGAKFLVNIPALLTNLEKQSRENISGIG